MSDIIVMPTYKDVFVQGTEKTIPEYLSAIPTYNVVALESYYSAAINNAETDFNVQNDLLINFLRLSPTYIQQCIFDPINELSEGKRSVVFHSIACQLIIQTSLINYVYGRHDYPSEREFINIFKAHLVINETISNKSEVLMDSVKSLQNEEKYLGVTIPMLVSQAENIRNPKYFISQSIKAKYFFEFVQEHEPFKTYFQYFLDSNKISSWGKYLEPLWKVFIMFTKPRRTNEEPIQNIIYFNDSFIDVIKYLEGFTFNANLGLNNVYVDNDFDFKILRDYPLFRLDKNHFAILNLNFFLDKIYHSLQFNYHSIMQKKGYTHNLARYRGILGKEFTEEYLFYKVIEYMFEKKNYIKVSGAQYEKQKRNKDYSDYYIRSKNRILLFECKDRIMRADVKYSYDKEKVYKDIDSKFITGAGCNQLLNTIGYINEGGFDFDKIPNDFVIENDIIEIYPVIVYTDQSYSIDGINYYINQFFNSSIQSKKYVFKVYPVTLMEIDKLIIYLDYFNDENLDLFELIKKYHDNIRNYINIVTDEKYEDFTLFFEKENVKKGYRFRTPKLIKDLYHEITK